MDNQFDELSKPLADGVSRREALKKLAIGLAGGLLACSGIVRAQAVAKVSPATLSSSGGYLLVSSFATHSVLRYDETNGAFVDTFVPSKSAGLREPWGLIFGPDRNVYVSSGLDADNGTGTGHRDVL